MSAEEHKQASPEPAERTAIGIAFGNSNSSIGHTSGVRLICLGVYMTKKSFLITAIDSRRGRQKS